MQFRDQANRTQVLAYRGYNKEKKRADVKLLGSFDRFSFELSDELKTNLTVDEMTELQSHIETVRQSRNKSVRRSDILNLHSHIDGVSDSLTDPEFDSLITSEYATQVYASIDRLTKVLRRKGHRRPQKGAAERSPGESAERAA